MSNTIKCPYCAEEIKSEARICKHCQKDLTTSKAKNLINIELKKIKAEENKKEIEHLASRLESKLEKYPEKIRKKLKTNKNFLNKLENMSEEEIEKGIFRSEREGNIGLLWILSIVIGFFFPIVYLFTIWLHPKKDEKDLFINRFKNFKNHKMRIVVSIIFLLLFSVFYVNEQNIKQQRFEEQQKIEKINNTTIKVSYDINEQITNKQEINIVLELNNIKSLKINDKDITVNGDSIHYKQNLKLGENDIFIVGYNDDIEKKIKRKIKRVTEKEYIKAKKEEKSRIEAEKQRKAEIEMQQKLKQEKKNRAEQVEKQFSGWDGSHRQLTRQLKSTLKDPSSYEHINTKYWILKDIEEVYYLKIVTKYRAKNSFGGYQIGNIQAYFDIKGNPIKTENWSSY